MIHSQVVPFGYCHCGCGEKTKIANGNNAKYGWVYGQPFKYVLHHRGKGLDQTPLEDRFWSKVDRSGGPDACWPYTGGQNDRGYGRFWRDGEEVSAARMAWEIENGRPFPADHVACHTCDNPPCCNPAHVFAGTHADNARDMVAKGRQSNGASHAKAVLANRPRGDRHHRTRFSDEEVAAMHVLYATREWSQRRIARLFGTSQPAIQAIVSGRSRSRR